ncbi:MAG: DUF4258 domain-containing protein [Atribacterota bacterium]|nr:DUF4258 domain-containing protein [Atribacterota bacterium]MDD4896317.1 DUF4258 domain-containing protein [Atribacterota bacterium]
MNLIISAEAEEKMNARGIKKEDVEAVIKNAESKKTFLIADDGSFLAKHRLENFCPYVAYSKEGDDYTVNSVYAHLVLLGHEFQ